MFKDVMGQWFMKKVEDVVQGHPICYTNETLQWEKNAIVALSRNFRLVTDLFNNLN